MGKEFGGGGGGEGATVISRANKLSQISCLFSCLASGEGPACQLVFNESRHEIGAKRGQISTSTNVVAQLDQPP